MNAIDVLAAIGFALICLGLLIFAIPVGCDACPHCRLERLKARCPLCFHRHAPEERCP